MVISLAPHENCTEHLAKFCLQHGVKHIVAFAGGSNSKGDHLSDEETRKAFQNYQSRFTRQVLWEACAALKSYPVAILTGGTKDGVPEIGAKAAKDSGLKTIGIFPSVAKEDSILADLDIAFRVGPFYKSGNWGDESPFWSSVCDAVIVLGGASGTLIEMAHIMKINEGVAKTRAKNPDSDIKFKHIVPVHGLGGVAEQIQFVWAMHEVRDACMPKDIIKNGQGAAQYILTEWGYQTTASRSRHDFLSSNR